MDKLQKFDLMYKSGKYIECCDILKKLQPYLVDNPTEDAQCILNCIVNNNLSVCVSLLKICTNSLDASWSTQLDSFILLYNNWRSFSKLPLQLHLTLAYNTLCWYWYMPESLKQFNTFYDDVLFIAVNCLNTVLESSQTKGALLSDHIGNEETVFLLMKSTSNLLLSLSAIETIALLNVYNVLLLIFLKEHKLEEKSETFFKYAQFCEKLVGKLELIEKYIKSKRTNKNASITSTKSGYCIFGFEAFNNVLTENFVSCLNSSFHISVIFLVKCDMVKKAITFLSNLKIQDSDYFSSFALFLKALCFFNSGQFDEAFIELNAMHNFALHDNLKFYHHILLGRCFSKQKKFNEASNEFFKAKEISLFEAPVALYYLFENAKKFNNVIVQVRFLDEMYQCQKEIETKKKPVTVSDHFHAKLLEVIYPTSSLSMLEVLYLQGKVNLEYQKYSVAETYYSKVLKLLKENGDSSDETNLRLSPLPPWNTIYQEAIKSSIETGNLDWALENCHYCMAYYGPSDDFSIDFSHSKKHQTRVKFYDDYLLSLNKDCVCLILLSEIYFQMNEDSKALDSIERCIAVVLNHLETVKKKNDSKENNTVNSEELSFFNCFLAKLFLCKATLFENLEKNFKDITSCYEKALMFNKGDSAVLYHYARILVKQGNTETALSLKHMKRNDVPLIKFGSVALKLIFKPEVTEENWKELNLNEDDADALFEDSE